MDFKNLTALFVVLTVVFGGTTGYLVAGPGGTARTVTNTVVSVSTIVSTSTQVSTASSAGPSGYTVNIAYKAGIGFYLVNGSGFTLYYRTTDVRSNGTSTCTGACIQAWPAFFTSKLVLPPGLNASSFGTVTRADGKQQLTIKGWPLYLFAGDGKAGSTDGQGIQGIWFAYTLQSSTSTATTTTTSSTTFATSTLTTQSTSTTTATTTSTMTTSTTSHCVGYYC